MLINDPAQSRSLFSPERFFGSGLQTAKKNETRFAWMSLYFFGAGLRGESNHGYS
jgi:hypothetical protein